MIRPLSLFKFNQVRPPVRRLLAVDAGSRRLKMLLAESDFGHLRILKQEVLDLQAEGLVSTEELKAHLQPLLEEWGRPPVALVLPQHLCISQVVDLPPVTGAEVNKLIADEIIKLSGVSESRIIYDFVRTEAQAQNRQEFWVTLAQESDIRERIGRLALEHEDLCEVTTTANALIAAYRAAAPLSSRAVLVHMGAQTTVLVVLLAGQGAFAASFQMGGDFFTRAVARAQQCSEAAAEALKREVNLLNGPRAVPEFATAVDGWVAEFKRQLAEWFHQNPGVPQDLKGFQLVASGGGLEQPGLLEDLRERAGLNLQPWPKNSQPDRALPAKGYEVAFGLALQALGYSAQSVSLLPDDYRLAWKKRQSRQRVELASFVLLAACILLLALGTWHQISLFNAKRALLDKVQAGLEDFDKNEALTADLLTEYENLRPVLARQQNTVDTLKMLALLEQSRSNRNLWYVLLADQQSYFSRPPALLSTNRPARTNLLGSPIDPARPTPLDFRTTLLAGTNAAPVKPGFIAEFCVPGEPESSRQVLSDVVNSLKQQPLFSKVDLLSDDLRRDLADPKVILPDRHYVLALDFAVTDFQQPARLKKPAARHGRSPRSAWPGPDPSGNVTQTVP